MSTSDVRFGQLWLARGEWTGFQLLNTVTGKSEPISSSLNQKNVGQLGVPWLELRVTAVRVSVAECKRQVLQSRSLWGSPDRTVSPLSCQPRGSEPPHTDSRKVLESPEETRTPAAQSAHARSVSPWAENR